mmetsp:Transcript_14695/g.34958  ORF Transcript_14695/g.34958 Transcript_14695/m.34958 type:complete len:216 (-) Transcript_14695:1912-2559(-)
MGDAFQPVSSCRSPDERIAAAADEGRFRSMARSSASAAGAPRSRPSLPPTSLRSWQTRSMHRVSAASARRAPSERLSSLRSSMKRLSSLDSSHSLTGPTSPASAAAIPRKRSFIVCRRSSCSSWMWICLAISPPNAAARRLPPLLAAPSSPLLLPSAEPSWPPCCRRRPPLGSFSAFGRSSCERFLAFAAASFSARSSTSHSLSASSSMMPAFRI